MAKLKKVFVSGCFDMLHSGHVCFLSEAAKLGEVHVALGSDRTVRELKGRLPVNSQEERRYMLQALKCVKSCRVNLGSGILDFLAELRDVDPDIFLVNEEGNTPAKEKLCRDLGIEYRVLKRIPHGNLPARSTTSLRRECRIPYRLDLAGGWLDQAFVSRHAAGPVLTVSVEPTLEFNERSGMASSTRRRAVELWQTDLPGGDRENAKRRSLGDILQSGCGQRLRASSKHVRSQRDSSDEAGVYFVLYGCRSGRWIRHRITSACVRSVPSRFFSLCP
jgi:cytidyltransferase-like protein